MEINYNELNKKLSRLQWLLQHHHMQNRSARGPMADPTRGQGRVLAILKLQPEISSKDLSYLLGVRQQSLNELLNKLEKNGYVTRKPSDADKRVMMVQITEKGKEERQTEGNLPEIFDCLSKEEQEIFGGYLDRIIIALEEQLGVEDEEMSDWMDGARFRMGDQMFEHLMTMHRGSQMHREGRGHEGRGYEGRGHEDRGHEGRGHEGRGHEGRGHEGRGYEDRGREDHGRKGCGREGRGQEGRGREKRGHDNHIAAPKRMPGAERLDPDYDAPLPGRED